MKQEQRKSNKQEKVKKAPKIEGINLQKKTSIANAITLENTLAEINQLLFTYTSNRLNTLSSISDDLDVIVISYMKCNS